MAGDQANHHHGDGTAKVKVTNKTHVKPNKAVGRKECQLVTFDLQYLTIHYNQKLLLYKGCGEHEEAVGKLKDGLGVVLEEFHQLAGKIGKDDDGVLSVEYDDDDVDGVEVVEAVCEEWSVDDLAAEEGTTSFKDLIMYNGVLNLEGQHRPLLAVQLTKLKDGLAIGLAFNHAVLDGTSTWHFMSEWARICSGSPAVSVPPFLDRTKARNTRVQLDLSLPPYPLALSNGDDKPEPAKLKEKVFKFSETAIDTIKSTVNSNPPSDGSKPFSTFQSLSVHIWRHVTEARQLKPEDTTVFTVFADCRRRVDPPMPENYFGNLIQAIFMRTEAGLLVAQPPEFGAAVIQKAIESHDAKAIEARNEEWEKMRKNIRFRDAGMNCVAVGSSPRFKVYEVDFGWGPPESVRSGENNRFDGLMYLYQGKAGGRSIDVHISLPPEVMYMLENDKEFLVEG